MTIRPLVVLKDLPVHEGSAPGKTAVGLVLGLLANGLDVRVVAARQHFAPPEEPDPRLRVEVVDVAPARAPRLARLRRPRGELAGDFAARVGERSRSADVVHLEEPETLWAGERVGVPAVLHLPYLVRRDRPLTAPWGKDFRRLVEYWLAERAAIRRYGELVASSPAIAAALRQAAPRAHVTLAPLSLDPDYYAAARLETPLAGFIGTAAWPPTAAAASRLLQNVWPIVRREAPDARLLVAGRGTAELVGERAGVAALGAVESARDFFAGVSVLVFPLARGSGMKVKTLEALASGVPVVTTAAGAEGIVANDGVIVAEDDAELARAAAGLLRDEAERRERGAAARAAFDRYYDPRVATEPLVDLYRRLAG
jgi:glycosyltransferase involved in cell wall biosynthesis